MGGVSPDVNDEDELLSPFTNPEYESVYVGVFPYETVLFEGITFKMALEGVTEVAF